MPFFPRLAAFAVLTAPLLATELHASAMNEYTLAPAEATPVVTTYRPATVQPVPMTTTAAPAPVQAMPMGNEAPLGELIYDTQPYLPDDADTTGTTVMQPYQPNAAPAPLQPVPRN